MPDAPHPEFNPLDPFDERRHLQTSGPRPKPSGMSAGLVFTMIAAVLFALGYLLAWRDDVGFFDVEADEDRWFSPTVWYSIWGAALAAVLAVGAGLILIGRRTAKAGSIVTGLGLFVIGAATMATAGSRDEGFFVMGAVSFLFGCTIATAGFYRVLGSLPARFVILLGAIVLGYLHADLVYELTKPLYETGSTSHRSISALAYLRTVGFALLALSVVLPYRRTAAEQPDLESPPTHWQ